MFEGREVAGGCSRGGVEYGGKTRGTGLRRQCRRGRSHRDHGVKVVAVVEEEEAAAEAAEAWVGVGGAHGD